MERETVIKMRDKLKGEMKDAKLRLICDNMMLFNEKTDVIQWNDDEGILVAFRKSVDYSASGDAEFSVTVMQYSDIQYMILDCGRKSIERIGNDLELNEESKKDLANLVYKTTHFEL